MTLTWVLCKAELDRMKHIITLRFYNYSPVFHIVVYINFILHSIKEAFEKKLLLNT